MKQLSGLSYGGNSLAVRRYREYKPLSVVYFELALEAERKGYVSTADVWLAQAARYERQGR